MRTILVVEDEPQIAGLVRDYLEHAGFAVLAATDGPAALALARARRPDALVLDLGLPRMDGLDVIRAIRRGSRVPILVLSARGDEADRVAGLELGADDYVTKPFSPRELVARVRAVLRRAEAIPLTDERITAGDLELDLVRRRVTAAGRGRRAHADRVRAPGDPREGARARLDAIAAARRRPRVQPGDLRAGHRRPHPQPAPQARAGRCRAPVRADRAWGRLRARGSGRVTWRDHRPRGGPPWAGPGRDPVGRLGRRTGRHRRGGVGCLGCFVLGLVLLVGLLSTLATWVAGALLGILAPSAAPSTLTAVAVIVVLVVALLAGIRVFVTAVRPLGEIAAATTRLADGEPGVRVEPRGPRPVRGLGVSFNTMAERLDRSRDDRRSLLADVTHELRTPLTVVQGGLEAMLDGVHPMDEDHLAPILAETAVMDRLLDDLRTLSLADAGALTLHREPADLSAIAREAAAAQSTMAAAKRVELLGRRATHAWSRAWIRCAIARSSRTCWPTRSATRPRAGASRLMSAPPTRWRC